MSGNDGDKYRLAIIDAMGQGYGIPVEFERVTTILGVLKGGSAFSWWGYKLGIEAMLMFARNNGGVVPDMPVEEMYELQKEMKLVTPHGTTSSAAFRGSEIHDLVERWYAEQKMPTEDSVHDVAKPYVKAFVNFLECVPLSRKVALCEQPVYSLTHHVAGTLDLLEVAADPAEEMKAADKLTRHSTGTERFEPVPADAFVLTDFKTAKDIYDSHEIQTAAYEGFAREMGVIPEGVPCVRRVVCLQKSGKFKVKTAGFGFNTFLAVKALKEALDEGS